MTRVAQVERATSESSIRVAIDLDGTGASQIHTGCRSMITCLTRCLSTRLLT